ncbi:MAG: hypothetical protein SAK29_39000, partial [Scytonema sp. PMC 1069.18]|nr:hypothetical protein [Scytonema sp. PMC 1069.18]
NYFSNNLLGSNSFVIVMYALKRNYELKSSQKLLMKLNDNSQEKLILNGVLPVKMILQLQHNRAQLALHDYFFRGNNYAVKPVTKIKSRFLFGLRPLR